MQPEQLRSILQSVAVDTRSVGAALDDLRDLPYENLGKASLLRQAAAPVSSGETQP